MKRILYLVEQQAFGVCSKLGEILGISSNVIRMYFIYITFLTFGSPILVYLALAFWMNVKRYIRRGDAVSDFF
jgi:phage shock protein PspC (stress-responsive transcriptional regulator)